jgi:Arc/MetJ-type ribon-helix-helix transcriptional regulator
MLRRKREVERVTAALDKNLVQWMDQQIEKGIYRSRTHCIEDCIRAKKT